MAQLATANKQFLVEIWVLVVNVAYAMTGTLRINEITSNRYTYERMFVQYKMPRVGSVF